MSFLPFTIENFVCESNRIEGICRVPTPEEIKATFGFVERSVLTISDLIDLVKIYQPNAVPRFSPGLNVRVGAYYPPPSGVAIQERLLKLVTALNEKRLSAYAGHVEYEMLHPFTDGNGRSGRAVWLWAMGGAYSAPLGFLHTFYYQTLQHAQGK